ncbi:MAG TPA: response regulator [Acidimicrobiia bacterium]
MRKVLLVADGSWVVNHVRRALPTGVELTEISDPRAVVDQVRVLRPDVVIIDLQVASMGGMAVTRSLKSTAIVEGWKPLTIVLLLDRSADAFLAKRAGADAWVTKPATPGELRRAMGIELSPARAQR